MVLITAHVDRDAKLTALAFCNGSVSSRTWCRRISRARVPPARDADRSAVVDVGTARNRNPRHQLTAATTLPKATGPWFLARMSNVLDHQKASGQVLGLGRL
jgi:hypothetical protein